MYDGELELLKSNNKQSHVNTWGGASVGKCSKLTIASVERADNVLQMKRIREK